MSRIGFYRMQLAFFCRSYKIARRGTARRNSLVDGQQFRLPAALAAEAKGPLATDHAQYELLMGFGSDQNFLCAGHFLIYNRRELKHRVCRSDALAPKARSLSLSEWQTLNAILQKQVLTCFSVFREFFMMAAYV